MFRYVSCFQNKKLALFASLPFVPLGGKEHFVSTYNMKPQICHIGTKSLESALPSWVFFQAFAPQTDTTNCAGAGSMAASRVRRDDCPALCRKTLKESNGKVGLNTIHFL